MNNIRAVRMEHCHINKGQEQCRVSGRSNVAPRDKKSRRSYQAQRFQLIYTQYLVFGIDTHNDAANTDIPHSNFVINAAEQVTRLHGTGC